jgi:PKD repeat protein
LTKTALRTGGEFSGTIINLTNNANGINRYREFSPNVFIEDVGFQDITVTYSPPLKFAKATSTVGEIFNSTGILDYTFSSLGTYPLNYDSTTKLVKFENITVPAGSFATVKIQNSITIYGYINGQYLSIPITGVSWYAKYIGSVKSIQTSNGVQTTQELTSINFQPFLKSDFSVNQVNGIAPLSLIFTDQSDGNISSWLWSFGDGGTSTLQNPSHTYNTPGIYTVSLSVSGMGDSDVETKSNYINIKYPPPLADFSVNQVNGIAPLSLTFTDQSDGNISSWSWFFGDGGTSTLQNPSHTYNIPGTYTVSLSVEGLGGADLETKTKYIKVALAASDIDNSQKVDLNDLYLVLKILTINHEQPLPLKIFDIDGDNKTGIEEASYILYFMAE